MATTPTNKPIPSEDPRDLKFNAGKIDEEVNGSADYYADRFGVQRLTNTGRNNQFQVQMTQQADDWLEQFNQQNSDFQQFLLNSGYQFLGDYESGPYTITALNQIIRYQNEFWRLNASTNPPYTTTGVNSTSWTTDVTHLVSVGDATLRQELSSIGSGKGADFLPLSQGGSVQDAINYITPEMFPTVQSAIDAATSLGTYVMVSGGKTFELSDSLSVTCNIKGDNSCLFVQTSDSKSCLEIVADHITVSGVNVTPAPVVSSSLQFAGIVIKNANFCVVENCNVFYVGRSDREGSGIGIYHGNDNIIRNCRASGANLAAGTRHDYGGNDFFVYGNSSRNRIFKCTGIGQNIRGLMQQTSALGQQCNYNEYDSVVSIGHIGYGHLCYELLHDSTTSMRGTVFRNGLVANITGSATDPSSGLKYFGAGVYNQEGQDTRIEGYYIYNVCQDSAIEQTLPMAGISSTRGEIHIQNCYVYLSGRAGVKISTSGQSGDNRNPTLNNLYIRNAADEAIYLVNTNRATISVIDVASCGRIVRASANSAYAQSNINISTVSAKSSTGMLIDGFATAIVSDVNTEACAGAAQFQNISYLLGSKIISNLGTGTGIVVASTVTDGFLKDCTCVSGATGFNLAGQITYTGLIGKNNTTNFTGAFSGIATLQNTASVDATNINFAQAGAGTDITTITGGRTNQLLTIRATAARVIVHNTSSIILKSGANVSLATNSTIQLWCIDGTRWIEI